MSNELDPAIEDDEDLAWIRRVRHQISQELGHDPYRLVAYYIDLQKQHPERLIKAPSSEATGKGEAE